MHKHSNSSNSSRPDVPGFPLSSEKVTWGIAFGVLGALIVSTNLLTLLIYSFNSRLRRRSVYCLMNLAAADLIVGFVAMPLYSSYLLLDSSFWANGGLTLLHSIDIVYQFTSNMSMFSLVLVSVERMYATVWPWKYRNTGTRRFIAAICLTWVVGFTQGVLYYVMKYIVDQREALLAVLAPILLLSIITICTSYIAIYVKIKQQHHHRHHHHQETDHQQQSTLQRAIQRDRDLALTLFIVTVSSLISWLPYAIMQIFAFAISIDAIYGITFLQCCNSLINPVIYVFRMQEFRRALIQLCKCSKYYPHVSPLDQNRSIELTAANQA